MGKASKATKKFASSGQLKKTIEARRKHQQVRKRIQSKKTVKGKQKAVEVPDDEDVEDEEEEEISTSKKRKMTVDDFLGAGFMNGSDDEEDQVEADGADSDNDMDDDEDDIDDGASFADVDDLDDDEGQNHLLELSKLAETDPEFYKYLQENDKELLDFDASKMDGPEDEDMEDAADIADTQRRPPLTNGIIRKWQKGLLEHRSLRALRKLLIAFRAAVHMNDEDQVLAWSIDSSSVYNKLVSTTLMYTPIVLEHHVPFKKLPNGKFKSPTQTKKLKALQKLILSYFHNTIQLLSQVTDSEMMQLAITESAKIIPYVVSSRKTVKVYLKKCLELWSADADDSTRIAAFLAVRKLASATDVSIMDNVLKGTYLTLVRSSKSTSAYTLPAINLMKNSASEIFSLDHTASYQLAFGYIRQLAIHLRNSMKIKTKEAYKQVYNWQYVHSLDFWCLVLARACDAETEKQNGGQASELKPLIYPVVQISLGAIKLISSSRSYPFHLHIIRSLLHLIRHTHTYIPISPYILPILTTTLAAPSLKSSTLRPLDFEVQIRAPQQYLKTRVYAEGLIDEASFLLAEWLASTAVQGQIAFPEVVIPIVVILKRSLKSARTGSTAGKDLALLKTLIERVEESSKWVESRRKNLRIAPAQQDNVATWQKELQSKVDESPLARYVKVQRKAREKRQKLVEKARKGEDEILESE
ncbi:Noc2-domain-containing protein [Hymenopellis radicata]|nr:Noc2-domain-containing protein [Hymenopellis radicata]